MPFTEYMDNLDGTVMVKDEQGRSILLPFDHPEVQSMINSHFSTSSGDIVRENPFDNNVPVAPVSTTDNTLFNPDKSPATVTDPTALQRLDRNGEYSPVSTQANAARYLGQDAARTEPTRTGITTSTTPEAEIAMSNVRRAEQRTDAIGKRMDAVGDRIIAGAKGATSNIVDPFGLYAGARQSGTDFADEAEGKPSTPAQAAGIGASAASLSTSTIPVYGPASPAQEQEAADRDKANAPATGNPYAQAPQQPRSGGGGGGYKIPGGWIPTAAQEQMTVYDPNKKKEVDALQSKVDEIEGKQAQNVIGQLDRAKEIRDDAQEKTFLADASNKDWEHNKKWLLDEENEQIQKNIEAVEKMKVDPNKFWLDKSVPAKIGLGIAAALSRLGNTLMIAGKASGVSSRNEVMERIDREVDRNIDAQKANIMNARGNLDIKQKEFLKHYNMFGDERQYRAAIKAKIYEDAESMIKREASEVTDEQAKVRAANLGSYLALERGKQELEATKVVRTQASKYQAPAFVGGSGGGRGAAPSVSNLSAREQKEFEKLNEELAKRGLNDSSHYAENLRRAALEARARGDSSVPGYGFGADVAETLPGALGKRVISREGVQNQQSGRIIARQTAKANNSGALSDKDVSDTSAALFGDGSPDAVLYGLDQSQRTKQQQLQNILNGASSPAVRELLIRQYGGNTPQQNAPIAQPSTYKPKQ